MNATFSSVVTSLALFLVAIGAQADTKETAQSTGAKVSAAAAKVGNATERGVKAAVKGVDHGVKAAANGIQRGAKATAKGIEHGAEATGRAADHVASKMGGASSSEK